MPCIKSARPRRIVNACDPASSYVKKSKELLCAVSQVLGRLWQDKVLDSVTQAHWIRKTFRVELRLENQELLPICASTP